MLSCKTLEFTWTLLASDIKALEAFCMKCQRQLLQSSWQQFIWNDEVAATTDLLSISEVISHRRGTLFGHVARLQQDVPAHKALHCHVDLSLGRPPNDQGKRRPGRPRERWIDQVRKDNGIPPADMWRRATSCGHRGATLRPRWLRDNDERRQFLNGWIYALADAHQSTACYYMLDHKTVHAI